ncbi:MAG: hypothetical protein L6R41_000497 [Letrouitia leprolyta]|nr:MAG: hypothetical protein L6R41_000497 [Letrouitia leprolyta]
MRRSPYLVVQVDQSDRATSVVKLKFISAGALLTPLPSERPEVAAALIKSENLNIIIMAPFESENDKGVTGAAKFATSTVGNTVGGLGRTVGGVVGAGGRGIGQTITAATGSTGKPVGDALENLGNGVERGAQNVSKGVEDAGKWK